MYIHPPILKTLCDRCDIYMERILPEKFNEDMELYLCPRCLHRKTVKLTGKEYRFLFR